MAEKAQWMIAQDSFATDLDSGASFTVTKGQHLLSTHEAVLKDAGRGILFRPAETADVPEEKPAKAAKAAE